MLRFGDRAERPLLATPREHVQELRGASIVPQTDGPGISVAGHPHIVVRCADCRTLLRRYRAQTPDSHRSWK